MNITSTSFNAMIKNARVGLCLIGSIKSHPPDAVTHINSIL
jgi:hypothetical protein